MQAIAVGAFHDEDIGCIEVFRRLQNRAARTANIPAEDQAPLLVRLRLTDVKLHRGRAEDVSRWNERCLDAVGHKDRPVKADADELLQGKSCVGLRVDWFDGRFTLTLASLVEIGYILFLNVAAVHQHVRAQVARG